MAIESEGLKVLKKEQMGQLTLTIKVSKDKLSLYVDSAITPSKDKIIINKDTLVLMLKEVVSSKILNMGAIEVIAVAANSGKGMQDRKVAQGTAPEDGLDGRLELLIKSVEIPLQGTDTRFVKDLHNLAPGTILGIIHPPTEGKSGKDVFGEEAKPKPGKPWKQPLDRSIVVKPSYDEKGVQYLIATTYGFLVREKERLRVLPALAIKSDVDLTSGNIDVKGKVEISGDVAKGFKVHARDDIAIRGRTHGSILSSQCGSIKVDQLVLGGPGLFASAGQSFTAQMIQNLKLKAESDVMISKDARDSEISANGSLLMKEGHLFGGQALALGGIEARIVGSEGGTPTIVGSRSKAEVEEEAKQLSIQIEENKKLCEAMGAKLGPVIKLDVEKIPVLELAHCKKINDLLSKFDDMKAECEVMERRLAKLQDALEREPWFQLNYGSLLHKGVTIKVGEDQFYLDNYKTGPGTIEYSAEKRSFSEVKYKELRALRPKKKVDPNNPATT